MKKILFCLLLVSNVSFAQNSYQNGLLGQYLSSPPALVNQQREILQLDASGNLKVNVQTGGGGALPTLIYAGQQSVTGSAAALPNQTLINSIVIVALSTNTCTIYVGPAGLTTSNGYPLTAGQAIGYTVNNVNAVYVIGATSSCGAVAYTGN